MRLLLLFFSLALGLAFQDENPLSARATLSTYDIQSQQIFELQADLELPKGYKAYGDKFKLEILEPEGFLVGELKVKPLKVFFDKVTNQKKMGVIEKAKLMAVLEAPMRLQNGEQTLKAQLTYQACTDTYCLFPAKLPINFTVKFTDMDIMLKKEKSIFDISFQEAMSKSTLWAFVIAFIAGLLTSLTPCIFPMIPITIAVLGQHAHTKNKKQNFILSNLYVLGIAITYSALGVFAAATGSLFGAFMNHPAVLTFICLIFLAMALSMFGLYELQPPEFIRKRFLGDLRIHGYHSAFIYGIVAGLVASPCVGPVLVGILTFVAKSQNLWLGFSLLFVFALGMGQLFLLIGVSTQITKKLPRSGPWMVGVKTFFALSMMTAFYYYLSLLLPLRWWDLGLGIGLIVWGSFYGAFAPLTGLTFKGKLRKGFCQMIIFLGATFVALSIFDLRPYLRTHVETGPSTNSTAWQPYSDKALADAVAAQKPVIIDFAAEWCAACHELDKYTFTHPAFKTLAPEFVLLKFDATSESVKLKELREKYEIRGLPTLIIYDRKGSFRKDLTVTEFLEAPLLTARMRQAM
jgi:thioredoxin:protein disulfide reductase